MPCHGKTHLDRQKNFPQISNFLVLNLFFKLQYFAKFCILRSFDVLLSVLITFWAICDGFEGSGKKQEMQYGGSKMTTVFGHHYVKLCQVTSLSQIVKLFWTSYIPSKFWRQSFAGRGGGTCCPPHWLDRGKLKKSRELYYSKCYISR